jgi:hypothetical protein
MRTFTVEEIEHAIELANKKQSKLTPEIVTIDGNINSPPKVRCLLNNIVTSNDNYLEVGSWQGGSLIAALYQNNVKQYAAIDNFCQSGEGNEAKLRSNFKSVFNTEPNLIVQDAYKVDLEKLGKDYTVYFYDGYHGRNEQKWALTYYYPVLADEFVLIVDDWDTGGWGVPEGTTDGIHECRLNVVKFFHLAYVPGKPNVEEWWNGVGVYILKK